MVLISHSLTELAVGLPTSLLLNLVYLRDYLLLQLMYHYKVLFNYKFVCTLLLVTK